MVRNILILVFLFMSVVGFAQPKAVQPSVRFIPADDPAIQYTGRIDFSNPKRPRFWAAGVYIRATFTGRSFDLLINDEVLGGNNHNYLEIVVDNDAPIRLQTKGKADTIRVVRDLPDKEHTITICKNTESGIGYLELVGFRCKGVVASPPKPTRKMEFIGNSITCGTGSDLSVVPCDKGLWYDQHNAYVSYGPTVARALNAQWHLSSVSGIGMIHSCCNMTITMPDVFDKVNMRANAIPWDFSRYVPDVVTICLGQNDGIQDSTAFCRAYVKFIGTIRSHYPNAQIVCLTSPMADAKLTAALKNYLTGIVSYANKQGDPNIHSFFFARSYNSGCGGHPDLAEHALMAGELSAFLKRTLGW
ncbi:SGNH/GDSL hydrolase family protein [Spirosoma taeanense]|uniref:SGNH/GDSL hydrolase family protein n=1 Tax=Spirosoma taeanense TaxID=2735870 RepID=A0A6M5Y9F9_9BACT|nr:SGNH/GDSL hydrolase family protein [Spirosoma taeanense]QJW89853.1 SGNH/GDSL hydrolase family protein [Spirosoma taeanense]